MLSACASTEEITKGDFPLQQKEVINSLNELYNYEMLIKLQIQNAHLPKRMTGRQGSDFLIEFELYKVKYMLQENTKIRIKKVNEEFSSVEIYSYRLGYLDKKRDKELELLRMKEVEDKLRKNAF
jgi:hypothetical protein